MKFQITNTQNKRWLYNNLNNLLEPIDGSTDQLDYLHKIFNQTSQDNFISECLPIPNKSQQIRNLRLFIGSNCNYKCSFCIQKYEKLHSRTPTDEEIQSLLKKFDDSVLKLNDDGRVEFWGGEPLVYYKALVKLIPELRKRYPKADFGIISNGTLITEPMIDFFIKHKVNLTFSHDGQAYFLRGEDPLQDPKLKALWRLTFKKYKEAGLHFGINCVITQYNTDLYELQRYLQENIDPEIRFGFEGMVVAHTDQVVNVCVFPKKAKEQLKQSIYKAIFEDKTSRLHFAMMDYVQNIVTTIVQNRPSAYSPARCGMLRPDNLAINMKGEVLKCHNVSLENWIIGHIDDLANVDLSHYKTWSDRKNCKNCHLLSLCHGDCPISNGVEHSTSCYTQKIFYQIFFDIAMQLITGSEIKNITQIS